ncbi:MAG: hypothetical protein MI757_11060 [Pirellulales bacterium]|nr:hypothetical protein [Pirellulales bacterium]
MIFFRVVNERVEIARVVHVSRDLRQL